MIDQAAQDAEQSARWFGYADATPEQTQRCVEVRTACAKAARAFSLACDNPVEREHGLRKLKEACQAMINGIVHPFPDCL